MNSLEFIKQNIFEFKNHIEHLEIEIIEDEKNPTLAKYHKERIEELKPILNHLQQIKTELEAWEVVKPNIVEEDNIIDGDIKVIKVKCQLYPKGESNGKYEKLKKALEVE